MRIDKSLLTNLIALLLAVAGWLLPPGMPAEVVMNVGLYALSGAFTNWLAIHMLFEKVPFFYGSGVIPARFEEFKAAIRNMMMEQFFNEQNIHDFLSRRDESGRNNAVGELLDELAGMVDFDKAFDALVEVIMQSSFGKMLGMVGGARAVEPMRERFVVRMREFLMAMAHDEDLVERIATHSARTLLIRVEVLVDRRLAELTPQQVKRIIERMIHEHLGWLVVWGGVVGGLIGIPAAFVA